MRESTVVNGKLVDGHSVYGMASEGVWCGGSMFTPFSDFDGVRQVAPAVTRLTSGLTSTGAFGIAVLLEIVADLSS
jgi:hypothetical protein